MEYSIKVFVSFVLVHIVYVQCIVGLHQAYQLRLVMLFEHRYWYSAFYQRSNHRFFVNHRVKNGYFYLRLTPFEAILHLYLVIDAHVF